MRSEKDGLLSVQRFVAGVLAAPWDIRTDLEAGDPPERPFALIESTPAQTTGGPTLADLILPVTVNLYLEQHATREAAADAAMDLRDVVWRAVKWGPDVRHPTTDRIPLFCYQPREEQHRFSVPVGSPPFRITVAGHQTAPLTTAATAADVAAAISAAMVAPAGAIVGQDRGTRLWDIIYTGALAGTRVGDPTISGAGSARVILEGAPAPWRGPSDFMRVQSFSQNTVRDATDPTLVMVAADLRLTFARGLPLPLDVRILQRVDATVGNGSGG